MAAALAILVGVALFTGFLAPPGAPSPGSAPASVKVVLRSTASSVAIADGKGWFADDARGTVSRFDPSSGATEGTALHTGKTPISIAGAYGRLWVADISKSLLYEVDPTTDKVSGAPIAVAQGPVSIAAGYGGVWVASLLAGTVSLVDPRTGEVEATVALPDGAVQIAIGANYVWVTGQSNTLVRIDPKPLGVTLRWREVEVGQGPIGVAVGAGAVWVANAQSGTVTEVDPGTLAVTRSLRVPANSSGTSSSDSDPQTVAVWQGRVWVGVGSRSALVAFDPGSGAQVGKAVGLPGVVRDLYANGDSMWATTANPGTVVELSAN